MPPGRNEGVQREADDGPRSRWTLGAGGLVLFGPAPDPLLGGSVWIERAQHKGFAHSLALGGEGAFTDTVEHQGTSSRFQWWAIRGQGCARGFDFTTDVQLWFCADAVVGATRAAGLKAGPIVDVNSVLQEWLSLGPALLLRFDLPSRVAMDFGASLDVPFILHTTKYSTPDVSVYTTAAVTGSLSVRLGIRSGSKAQSSAIAD